MRAHQLGHLSLISTEVAPQPEHGDPLIWLVRGAVADIAIVVVLSWSLLSQRKSSIPTGATQHHLAHRTLVLKHVKYHSTVIVPPTAIIGKLYMNCLITHSTTA
ncbi:hypothetical protein B0H14DRAFT_3540880 [Mycena olivaceomarginata]|nr:hypothetical protein B0H14DRAFT_3540880 [Mycena olivaceomarginata]